MSKCLFCGTELVDGKCPNFEQHLIKMCLNCSSCESLINDDGGEQFYCNNTTNMNAQLEKLQNALKGYVIEEIKLKPLPLKDCTKKCNLWNLNGVKISEELQKYI